MPIHLTCLPSRRINAPTRDEVRQRTCTLAQISDGGGGECGEQVLEVAPCFEYTGPVEALVGVGCVESEKSREQVVAKRPKVENLSSA
jgi:hypothetical protein